MLVRPFPEGTVGRLGHLLGWLAFAAALGATFWLYMRPDFMLDLGAFLAFCGIAP